MNAAPKTLRRLSELEQAGLASAEKRAALEQVAAQYAIAITPAIAELIDRADPHDPIARQFVPDPAELEVRPEERADPIGDDAHSPVEGIVHRYPDRVLLKLTHVCAVYCRFCFRREMIGPDAAPLTAKQLDAALAYIAGASGNLGGGADRRRSAGAVGAAHQAGGVAAGRDPARQDHPHPHPRADRRSGADHAGAGPRVEGQGQGDLRRGARQPSARADRGGAGRPARGWSTPAFRC